MTPIRNLFTAAAVAALALGAPPRAARAAAGPAVQPPPPPAQGCPARDRHGDWRGQPHRWTHRMHGEGPWFRLHGLDLTGAQRESAHALVERAHADFRDLHEKLRADADELRRSAPDDPNHAALVAKLSGADGALFADLIRKREAVRASLYALLTPAQKATLAKLQAQAAAHRAHCPRRRF